MLHLFTVFTVIVGLDGKELIFYVKSGFSFNMVPCVTK